MKRFFWIALFSLAYAAPPPDYFSFAGGVFDVTHQKYRTAEFEIEYKFCLKCWPPPNHYLNFRPVLGVMGTAEGSVYAYLGINFDLLLGESVVSAPGFAAGYYGKGGGKDLGYPVEFRSGIELAWVFEDKRRLGAHFYHLSNAGLAKRNPGEESLVFFYDIPIAKGFPFSK